MPSLEYLKSSMARLSSRKNPIDDERSKKSVIENLEIIWSGEAWTCNKQLKHYPSFCREGITWLVFFFLTATGKGVINVETDHSYNLRDAEDGEEHRKNL